ncbi:MAG: Ser-Thr-rich GPI-anchored membrane family protein [Promethearchaeota archaeon]
MVKFFLLAFTLIILLTTHFAFTYSSVVNGMNEKIKSSDHDDIFGEIYILKPSKSQTLIIGNNFSIKWCYKGSIEYVSIALYNDYKFVDSIVITTVNDGEYDWKIESYEESNDYLIAIWDYNDFNNIDFSDFFTIALQNSREGNNILEFVIIGFIIGIPLLGIAFALITLKLKRNHRF